MLQNLDHVRPVSVPFGEREADAMPLEAVTAGREREDAEDANPDAPRSAGPKAQLWGGRGRFPDAGDDEDEYDSRS